MGRFKSMFENLLTCSDDVTTTGASIAGAEMPTVEMPSEDIPPPLYSATAAEINYWHAFGCNVFVQRFLANYDLDVYHDVRTFDALRIGYDSQRRFVTFAVDESHYYRIELNGNMRPIDLSAAETVLSTIQQLRLRRFSFSKPFHRCIDTGGREFGCQM